MMLLMKHEYSRHGAEEFWCAVWMGSCVLSAVAKKVLWKLHPENHKV